MRATRPAIARYVIGPAGTDALAVLLGASGSGVRVVGPAPSPAAARGPIRRMAARYRRAFGEPPPAPARLGYEAMRSILQAVREAGPDGNDRAAVAAAYLRGGAPTSVLGPYRLDRWGTPTGAPSGATSCAAGGCARTACSTAGRVERGLPRRKAHCALAGIAYRVPPSLPPIGGLTSVRVRLFAVTACAALALGVAACGGDDNNDKGSSSGGGGGAGTVDLYSSLPLQGASKDQTNAMVKGIRLALDEAGNKAGDTTIKYTSLDDSTAQAGNWDPGQVAQNARKVAQDSKAVGYIGEFNSGASAISIPILNQAGIPQVSPANTYVGLTTNEPGSEKGEPDKYYPTGKRTYLRIVPRDTIQAKALLTLMKQDGCTKVAMANDKETYGAGLARLVQMGPRTPASRSPATRGSTRPPRTTGRWPRSSRARARTASCSAA